MKRISALLFLSFMSFCYLHGQLIINHLNTNITTLNESDINLAKSTLHIAYGHTSHGSQVTEGMSGLVGFANVHGKGLYLPNNIFSWNNGGTGGTLDLHDGAMGGDVGYYPDWVTNTVNYLSSPSHFDVNIIMWSWCGQAAGYSEQDMIKKYLFPMDSLESVYPDVKFVYMTCHLASTGLTGNLHLRNEQIRTFCNANNKILFDFADIECYDPDGVYYGDKYPSDGCTYDASGNGSTSETGDPDLPVVGSGDKNWAVDWQTSHTQNVDWYNCGAAHTQPLNANQKAYAAWHMYSDIAALIKLEEMPANFTASDTIVGNLASACFNATDTLTVTGEVDTVEFKSGSTVNLIAGKSIFLEPGFHAFEGSSTHAYITTENEYCFSSSGIIAGNIGDTKKSRNIYTHTLKDKSPLSKESFTVYPNPNYGRFTVELKNFDENSKVCVYNLLGMLIYETIAKEDRATMDLKSVQPGIYLVSVLSGQKHFIQKVSIQ